MSRELLSRREALKLSAAGVLGASASCWFETLAAHAADKAAQGVKHKSCILLFMAGGPSHTHSFDPKPVSTSKAIDTNVPGIQVSEHLPKMAQQMHLCSILRGMSTGEASHQRAKYLMHTGYRMGAGGTTYPSMGAVVSAELGDAGSEMPNFIALGSSTQGAGFLGPRYSPLVVTSPGKGIENLKASTQLGDLEERARLLDEFDRDLQQQLPEGGAVAAHQKGYQRAVALMRSPKVRAFNIDEEPESVRSAYGGSIGQSCLVARRLVEAGVPFVEVIRSGWDSHGQGNNQKGAVASIDTGFAALLADLKQRGLLDTTLVIWMGEFGRTPDLGSNHYAKAWSTVMAGGGIKAGQVVGKTDAKGMTVEDRPIGVTDFMRTVYTVLGIDPNKENIVRSRPHRLVDKGGKVIDELL